MKDISENTKAILLLTAPLIVSKKAERAKTLTLKEYNVLARSLHALGCQPHDLLGADLESILPKVPSSFDSLRLEGLLNRGFLLGQALAEWQRRSIWIVSRADAAYPERLKSRLREQAPPVLYGCGESALLDKGGLAVVGSRNISEELRIYAKKVGALAAEAHIPIVSGAARGIDSSAMGGALEKGGTVVGVMADSLGRAALAKANREALLERKLVLISAYDPSAGFNAGNAMQRNKAIYALADTGLVVTSDFNKGGTWTGAIEQLERLHFVPIFIRNREDSEQGTVALIHRGGIKWPEPKNGEQLLSVITNAVSEKSKKPNVEQLGLRVSEDAPEYPIVPELVKPEPSTKEDADSKNAADRLMEAVTEILLDILRTPTKPDDVADILNISKMQSNLWLKTLVKKGKVEKLFKPVRYQTTSNSR